MPPTRPESFRVTPGYASGYAGCTINPLARKEKCARRNHVTDVTVFRIPYKGAAVTSPRCPRSIGVLSPGGYTVTHPLIYMYKPLIYIYKRAVTVAVTRRNPGYAASGAGYASPALPPRRVPGTPGAAGGGL